MNDLLFRVLFGLIFGATMVSVVLYRRKAQAGRRFSLEAEGKTIAIALRLGGVVIWLYPLFYLFAPALVRWSLVDLPAPLRWLGVAGALPVISFILWAQNSLGDNVSPTVTTRPDQQLITHGPYRWIRHPLYTAGLSFFGCLSLIAGSWLLALLAVAAFALVLARLPKEEALLVERFGDAYRTYQQRTGRFLPRLGR